MKKKVILILGIAFILCLGVGGKVYMDRKEEQKKQILHAEEDIALYIAQNYEEVKKIEFGKFNQTLTTGSWHVMATVNNVNNITFSLSDLNNTKDLNVITNPDDFKLKEKKENVSDNLDGVDIIYWGMK